MTMQDRGTRPAPSPTPLCMGLKAFGQVYSYRILEIYQEKSSLHPVSFLKKSSGTGTRKTEKEVIEKKKKR